MKEEVCKRVLLPIDNNVNTNDFYTKHIGQIGFPVRSIKINIQYGLTNLKNQPDLNGWLVKSSLVDDRTLGTVKLNSHLEFNDGVNDLIQAGNDLNQFEYKFESQVDVSNTHDFWLQAMDGSNSNLQSVGYILINLTFAN